MNNNFKILIFFFLTFFLISCSSDDSESAVNYGTSTGNYLPLKTNNEWTYIIENQSLTNIVKIIETTQFGGQTYYEFTDTSEVFPYITKHWFAKNGATYLLKTDDATVNENGLNITIKSYEIPILKDDYDVNINWSGSVSPKVTYSGNGQSGSLPFKVTYTGKNFYKGDVTLNGTSYSKVIKTRINLVIDANSQVTTALEEYWYAENIGIIKFVTYNSDGSITEKDIYNYQLN